MDTEKMTLRDEFAAVALRELVRGAIEGAIEPEGGMSMADGVATSAYQIADAMMKAREQ